MQIAVYGKGGIGKSTISANLTAALAVCNSKVLQIDVIPLTTQPVFYTMGKNHNYPRLSSKHSKMNKNLADVLIPGFLDTGCIEAGGPRPGMGCAGRGILTAFDF